MTTNDPVPPIDELAETVLGYMTEGKSVRVMGPSGSGRTELFQRLAAASSCHSIDLLPGAEADRVSVAVAEANALLGSDALTMEAISDDFGKGDFQGIARQIVDRARSSGRCLVVRVPRGWERRVADEHTPDDGGGSQAYRFLLGLAGSGVPMTVIADGSEESDLFANAVQFTLKSHEVWLSKLESVRWGALSSSFQALCDATPQQLASTPVAWRLAVGAVALGASAKRVVTLVGTTMRLPSLVEELATLLKADDEKAAMVRRFVELRRPMATPALREALGVSNEWLPLFVECLGYGSAEKVRSTPEVRRYLKYALAEQPENLVKWHARLARTYEALDGAPSPEGLGLEKARAWCEKVHHAALSDDRSLWIQQHLFAPEQYWERGRALSAQKQFQDAAKVYLDCSTRFPRDGYSWHYLGYNLHQTGVSSATVEQAYRRALKFGPEKPWWNGRLVCLLVEGKLFAKARDEWRSTLQRLDPDGERAVSDPYLTAELHRHVAKAWIEAGRPEDAENVLQGLPADRVPLDLQELLALAKDKAKGAQPDEIRPLLDSCCANLEGTVRQIVRTVQNWMEEGETEKIRNFLSSLACLPVAPRVGLAALTASMPLLEVANERAALAARIRETCTVPEMERLERLL